jgi:hypothetical protein
MPDPAKALAVIKDRRVQRGALAVAGAAVLAGAYVAIKMWIASVARSFRAARFALRVATFRVNRRCPDCRIKIRRDARVCGHCGHRLRPAN